MRLRIYFRGLQQVRFIAEDMVIKHLKKEDQTG